MRNIPESEMLMRGRLPPEEETTVAFKGRPSLFHLTGCPSA